MNYLEKLISNNFSQSLCFSPKVFSNESAKRKLKEIQEEHPELEVEIKNVRVTDIKDTERNEYAKVYFLVDVSGSVCGNMKAHFAAIQQGVLESLNEDYDHVNYGVILHHTRAKDAVTGYDWVNDAETGGTFVSTAYVAVKELNNTDNETDHYIVQLTDGDNWFDDNKFVDNIVNSLAIDGFKGFKYFEIGNRPTQKLYTLMAENEFVDTYRMKTGCTEIIKEI